MALTAEFFGRPTLEVARNLVGAVLSVRRGREAVRVRIVEVEAYLGASDPASHAGRGPTPRSAIMFGPPGVLYVYFIYGMYHCLNVVTEPEGRAGAVLVRAAEPLSGLEVMARRRASRGGRRPPAVELCNGPGKLCQALGIDLAWNGLSLLENKKSCRRVRIQAAPADPRRVITTGRIGVRRAADRPFRFVAAGSPYLSFPVRE